MSLAASSSFHLRVWTRFFASVEQVWELKTDPRMLAAELHPFAELRFGDPDGLAAAIRSGRAGQFAARLVPPGLDWPIALEAGEPGRRFLNHSENRLFSAFRYEHLFEPTPDGCRYIDAITFTPALPLRKATAIATQRVFMHRHRVAARHLPTDTKATAVAVLRALVEPASPDADA